MLLQMQLVWKLHLNLRIFYRFLKWFARNIRAKNKNNIFVYVCIYVYQLWTQRKLEEKQDFKVDSTQLIISVKKLIEKDKEYNLHLCLAFIVYEKGFDSVYISAVVKSLEDTGID